MRRATDVVQSEELAGLYARFIDAREAAIIAEIRRVCGVMVAGTTEETDVSPEEVAAYLWDATEPSADEVEIVDFEPAA
jgi:hypothetical protein